MAVRGLLALVDDIATLTRAAARKTAGLSGDDLAVNSKALAGDGIDPKRELPMVWQVAKGSLKNKFLYLIPSALTLSLVAPWAIPPLMMAGGAFLVYEGMEKIVHRNKHEAEAAENTDPKKREAEKVAGAIRTDFVLSSEIVVVALGAVAAAPFLTQVAVMAAVGLAMTAGIYGLVGALVKLDDIGIALAKKTGDSFMAKAARKTGQALIQGVPPFMKALSFVGTAAMFAVGGGILLHGLPFLAHGVLAAAHVVSANPFLAGAIETAASIALGMATGLAAIPVVKVLAEPASRALGFARDLFNRVVAAPVKELLRPLTQKFTRQHETSNDNTPAAPEQSGDALAALPSLTGAMNGVAQKAEPAFLPPEVKKPAPEFSAFEQALKRNFGR